MADVNHAVAEERRSFCRLCTTNCGMIVSVDEREQIVAIRPDREDSLTKGFACFKGLQAPEAHGARATHRFTTRRQRNMWNSIGRELPNTKRRVPYNPAKMNPLDIAAMGISSGDAVCVSSQTTTIETIVEADETLRRGVLSMTHGFGTLPDENDYRRDGVCANLLISTKREDLQTINAMPRMTAFAVAVSPAVAPKSRVSA